MTTSLLMGGTWCREGALGGVQGGVCCLGFGAVAGLLAGLGLGIAGRLGVGSSVSSFKHCVYFGYCALCAQGY